MPFNERQQVYSNGSFYIKDVARETDEGTYVCTAVNKQREKSQKELHVKVMSEYAFLIFFCMNIKHSKFSSQYLIINKKLTNQINIQFYLKLPVIKDLFV